MKYFKNIKNRVLRHLRDNFSLAVISIVIAVFSWFIISMTIYSSVTQTIRNVPLNIDITDTAAAENDLTLISCDVSTVEIQIQGNRAEIGNLSAENMQARLVADNVTSTGTKTLGIEITSINKNVEFQVKSIKPATATVVFDKYETREFAVTPDIPGVSFAEGKTLDEENFSCEPETVNITGPAAQLDKIAKCVAVSNKELNLDSSYSIASDEIKLYAEDGATIEPSPFKFDNARFNINIPVLTQKTLGLSVGIAGAPSNFDSDCLKFKFSADSITLGSTNSQLADFPDVFEIGKVLLSDLDIGFTETFKINTMDYKNMSNLETVTVTLDDSKLKSKEFVIDNFNISNAPKNYDFSVITNRLEVKVVGPADIIDNITSNDIVADINLLNAKIPEGESFNWDATISFPKYNNVWAVTHNKVILSKSEKTKENSGSPDIESVTAADSD